MQNTINKIIELLKDKNISSTNISSSNILYMLGVHYKEVIICRLIKAIIEPDGFHGLGNVPLLLFFEEFLGISNTELKGAEIILEEQIKDNRRVDIAIYNTINNDRYVYPIEVKIWAKDQNKQLFDYYDYYNTQKENLQIDRIYYLTPNGHPPSEASRNGLPENIIERKSFSEHIKQYLIVLKSHVKGVDNEEFKVLINNFIEVIDIMTSSNRNAEVFKALFNELSDNQDKNNLLILLNQKENLWEYIRNQYLINSIKTYSEKSKRNIEIVDVKAENIDTFDDKCIFILKYDNKTAYLCVHSKIYLARSKYSFEEGTFTGEWTQKNRTYDNSDYVWHYIYAKGPKKEKWNLKDIDEKLFEKTIDWEKYL